MSFKSDSSASFGVSSLLSELHEDASITECLQTVREHLGMDVAFVAEFKDGHRHIRQVDSKNSDIPILAGVSDPLEKTYCQRIVDGRLPNIIPDSLQHPESKDLQVTKKHQIGAYMGVPITLEDGSLYGTFCCLKSDSDPSLQERDLNIMKAFASLASKRISHERVQSINLSAKVDRIQQVLDQQAIKMVYQPIFNWKTKRIVGFEALSRFIAEPSRTPDVWFAEAQETGLGEALELLAIKQALEGLDSLAAPLYVSVNASPDTVQNERFMELIHEMDQSRIVVEITEHISVEKYAELADHLATSRTRGLRIAVDDAGAGFASFRHILNLMPDIIKLDMSITRDIHTDHSRQALVGAFGMFADKTHALVIAEGVENSEECAMLLDLNVQYMQGYYLGKPMPLEQAIQLMD